MKITYKPNPLDTTIELDDHEKQILWYKIMVKELTDALYGAHFRLQEGQFYDVEKAKKEVDPDYYFGETDDDSDSPLHKRVTQLHEWYLAELAGYHMGDCTCFAASCGKCIAEDLVGVNTIAGLGKHSAYKIDNAMTECNGDTNAALEYLKNYNPKISDAYKGKEALWYEHLPRWKKEAESAYKWFKEYKEKHNL